MYRRILKGGSAQEATPTPHYARILKANPYHDELGRFSTKDKAKFVSTGPKFAKSMERAKKQVAAAEKAHAEAKYLTPEQNKEALRALDRRMVEATQKDWESLSSAHYDEVRNYTAGSSIDMNMAISSEGAPGLVERGLSASYIERLRSKCSTLDEVMNRSELPENLVLFRAMNVNRLAGFDKVKFGASSTKEELSALVGSVFVDTGYGSSSTDLAVASSFSDSGRPIFSVKAPKGTKGVWVGSDHLNSLESNRAEARRTSTPDEHEFTFSRNMAYKVTGVGEMRDRVGRTRVVVNAELLNPNHLVEPGRPGVH